MPELHEIASAMVAPGKGILAADESVGTMSKRLEGAGVEPSPSTRGDYRRLLLTTPGLATWISGVILSDETMGQEVSEGVTFPEAAHALGILPGVKVDTGITELPFSDGGSVTQGLDGLRERLAGYLEAGAVFAKWRAVLDPSGLHSRAVHANAHALARYAALCQEAGLVPIVEPEVLMTGDHSAARCEAVTSHALEAVFGELDRMGVDPQGIVLKPNMIVAGVGQDVVAPADEVARRTLQVLRARVPAAVPGVSFLSGGQSNEQACANLAAINAEAGGTASWRLTFSFGRALVDDALRLWAGDEANRETAQQALAENCRRASEAGTPAPEPVPA